METPTTYFPDIDAQFAARRRTLYSTAVFEADNGVQQRKSRWGTRRKRQFIGRTTPLNRVTAQPVRDFLIACKGRAVSYYVFLRNTVRVVGHVVSSSHLAANLPYTLPYKVNVNVTPALVVYDDGVSVAFTTDNGGTGGELRITGLTGVADGSVVTFDGTVRERVAVTNDADYDQEDLEIPSGEEEVQWAIAVTEVF